MLFEERILLRARGGGYTLFLKVHMPQNFTSFTGFRSFAHVGAHPLPERSLFVMRNHQLNPFPFLFGKYISEALNLFPGSI